MLVGWVDYILTFVVNQFIDENITLRIVVNVAQYFLD
jgi:hypothetical protein